jgi:hypothetical protein
VAPALLSSFIQISQNHKKESIMLKKTLLPIIMVGVAFLLTGCGYYWGCGGGHHHSRNPGHQHSHYQGCGHPGYEG